MGQRIFITGGGSGLGQAMAKLYDAQGWKVCIGDRNVQALQDTLPLLSKQAIAMVCDVQKESDLIAVRERLTQEWGGVDIVVNNAGVSVAGGIDQVPIEDWQWIVDINLIGVARGCKVFTPVFKKQGSGHFINIASMAGLIHPPQMAPYNATKAAVVALSETLKVELYEAGIGVSVVCPAFFRTNLADSQRSPSAELDAFTRKLVTRARVGADEVAAKVKEGVEKGDFHILTHANERRIWLFKRAVPYAVFFKAFLMQMKKMARKREQVLGKKAA